MENSEPTPKIEFPESFTIVGNMALAIWIALDSLAIMLINLGAGAAYLLAALIGVYGILKFLGCLRPCYNCKRCTFGMGRLAALYFGNRNLKDYKYNYKLPTAIFFYALIGPFPAAVSLAYAVAALTPLKVAVTILLLVLTVYSGLTWRRVGSK